MTIRLFWNSDASTKYYGLASSEAPEHRKPRQEIGQSIPWTYPKHQNRFSRTKVMLIFWLEFVLDPHDIGLKHIIQDIMTKHLFFWSGRK